MKNEFNAEIELIAGGGGVFEVSLDNTLIFSKSEKRRFPDAGEIAGLIRGR